ncbi:MAG: N-formylglutamate amidohydrolase [bacterium]|nr:N-formylglutamate amidohydrolase [bacterium]
MASQEQKTIEEYFQPAFALMKPAREASPFIFSSPHSGQIYPAAFLQSSKLTSTQLRSSEDAYVNDLFAHVADQGAHFIHALVPRAYLDLNRHPHELDPKLFARPLPDFAMHDSIKVKSGLGVIARFVSEGREIYTNKLDLDDAQTRINRLYFPYHNALRALIAHTQTSHQHAILIDCHSMPSGNLPDFQDIPPDFVLGNQFNKSCDYELTQLVRAQLQSMGYHVNVNKPYAGGYVTKEYGKPQNGVHVLQIEINRRLYLNERTLEKTRGFEELCANLQILTNKLITSLPDLSYGTSLAAE